jgi:hypothetical protein
MMPFDRMDKFNGSLSVYQSMLKHIAPEDCPCSIFVDYDTGVVEEDTEGVKTKDIVADVCSWPVFHGDIRELKKKGTYRNIVMGCLVEDGSKTRMGRSTEAKNRLLDVDTVIQTVTKRAVSVTNFLLNGLRVRVYTNQDVIVINHIRRLLDLRTLVASIETHGATAISTLKWKSFKDSAVFVENAVLARIGEDELRLQFREFVRRLGKLGSTLNGKENTSIFAMFIDPKLELFRYCSMFEHVFMWKYVLIIPFQGHQGRHLCPG